MLPKPGILILLIMFSVISCQSPQVPKPRGFFRIDLPEGNPVSLELNYPYTFVYKDYGIAVIKDEAQKNKMWVDIIYPKFNGTLHISYKEIDNDLGELIEDAHTMVMKHIPKSSGIDEILYRYPESKVYGTGYHIKGSDAASPFQFYVTDSVTHFMRGALYFNTIPNNDSLAPVISFLKRDIEELISTIQWQD